MEVQLLNPPYNVFLYNLYDTTETILLTVAGLELGSV